MLKKISIIESKEEFGMKPILHLDRLEQVYFNTSLIKSINILKLKKKTVWRLNLTDDETLFVLPFKL
jgi:hypothetical protein